MFIKAQPRNGGLKRFDPSYDQAEVWQRLTLGKGIRKSDITFLKHERLELNIMRETGCTYEEAHEQANSVYDWWTEFLEEKMNAVEV